MNLIRWIIIFYSIITWTIYLIGMVIKPNEYEFVNRASGPYAILYWLMFLSALILPLTLTIKKIALKFWYVLLVAFTMKIGVYYERFVIIITSFHRDYLPYNENSIHEKSNTELIDLFFNELGIIFLQGVFITVFILIVFEIIKKYKKYG